LFDILLVAERLIDWFYLSAVTKSIGLDTHSLCTMQVNKNRTFYKGIEAG